MNAIIEPSVFDNKALADCSPVELIDLMIEHEDRVPRKVIDECAKRGEQMLDALAPLARSNDELEGQDLGHWWLRLHAVMILGLIPGERAGRVLLEFVHSLARDGYHDIQDWLAGYWPVLFTNKPDAVVALLRDICLDKEIDWYPRANMLEAVLKRAQQQGEAELEQTLDWAAQIAADEEDDWDYRLLVANDLLDFPRDRHRDLITTLAARQSGFGVHFDKRDIDKAYALGTDRPDWERFDNPWQFYDDRQIKDRQRRWQKEAEEEFDIDPNTIDVMARELGMYRNKTLQRATPKIGRNDPCPCGSGKKYKKCCLYKH